MQADSDEPNKGMSEQYQKSFPAKDSCCTCVTRPNGQGFDLGFGQPVACRSSLVPACRAVHAVLRLSRGPHETAAGPK